MATAPPRTTGCASASDCCARTDAASAGTGSRCPRRHRCANSRPSPSCRPSRARPDASAAHIGRPAAQARIAAAPRKARQARRARIRACGGRSPPLASSPGKQKPMGTMARRLRIVELLRRDAHPGPQPVPEGSVNGVPEACTRVPGAWLHTHSRAVALTRSTGRGSCGKGRFARRVPADPAGADACNKRRKVIVIRWRHGLEHFQRSGCRFASRKCDETKSRATPIHGARL